MKNILNNLTYNEKRKLADKLQLLIDYVLHLDKKITKIKNALYCYTWLLNELSPLSSYKMSTPTMEQRKDVIDVTKEVALQNTTDEQICGAIKYVAEYYKFKIDFEDS